MIVARQRLIIWLILVVAGAVALGLVAFERGAALQQDTDALAPNGLQLQSRNHVAICIRITPEAKTKPEQAVIAVKGVLPALQSSPRWEEFGLGQQQPDIDVGCPTEPYLLRPGVDGTSMFREIPNDDRITKHPSKYLIHLMVLSDSQIEQLFGDVKYPSMRVETHEYFCPSVSTSCVGVGGGLYLGDGELTDARYLWILVKFGLGLGNEMPIPAPEGTMTSRTGKPIQIVPASSAAARIPTPIISLSPVPSPSPAQSAP